VLTAVRTDRSGLVVERVRKGDQGAHRRNT